MPIKKRALKLIYTFVIAIVYGDIRNTKIEYKQKNENNSMHISNTKPQSVIKNWTLGLLGLSLIIIVHEMGHFLVCRLFNVTTPLFSIGFGPRLASFYTKYTTFQLAALPVGGYVEIDPTSMALQPYSIQMLIMFAGIIFNFLFAYIVFAYLKYKKVPASNFSQQESFQTQNHELETAVPENGSTPTQTTQLRIIRKQATALFNQQSNGRSIIGPIGIISIIGTSINQGFDLFIFILAILSINIGLFNLLPIPGLDGSQMLFLTIKKLSGPLSATKTATSTIASHNSYYNSGQTLIFIFLIIFFIIITYKDYMRIKPKQ